LIAIMQISTSVK